MHVNIIYYSSSHQYNSDRGDSHSQWTEIGRLNYPRAFGYLAYLPEPMCQENKLFILGGMNSVTLEPVLTTEVRPLTDGGGREL